MPPLSLVVHAFDPAIPFKTIEVDGPAVDTWHDRTLITKNLWLQLPTVPEIRKERLELSGGMSIQVPLVEIGFRIGSLKLDAVETLVVDAGHYNVLFGSLAIEQAFHLGGDGARRTSPWKDDPQSLSIQFYPVDPWIEVREVENLFRGQRQLYNVLLFAQRLLPIHSSASVIRSVRSDDDIPPDLRLKLTWIESGSIWATFKSASGKTLRYLASMFETGATAKLAQQMADAKKAETESDISQATRDATVARMVEEQERLRYDNIASTYATWRHEVTERLAFADELIAQLEDKEAAAELRHEKDRAIVRIVSQNLLPLVRNIPRDEPDNTGRLLLPPRE